MEVWRRQMIFPITSSVFDSTSRIARYIANMITMPLVRFALSEDAMHFPKLVRRRQ